MYAEVISHPIFHWTDARHSACTTLIREIQIFVWRLFNGTNCGITFQLLHQIILANKLFSGGFRNLERGVQSLVHKVRPKMFGLPRPLPVMLEVQTEYLEATLGLAKRLEISEELMRQCVTAPGCCCCMPLLYNHLMDSCSYVHKHTLLAAKGGCICTLLNPQQAVSRSVFRNRYQTVRQNLEWKVGFEVHSKVVMGCLIRSW